MTDPRGTSSRDTRTASRDDESTAADPALHAAKHGSSDGSPHDRLHDRVDDFVGRVRVTVPGYSILGVLGEGGQATVYKARGEDGELVAIKVLHGGRYATEDARLRLRREIRTLTYLRHRGIVKMICDKQTDDGCDCLVMEYVEGEPLNTFLERIPLGEVGDRLRIFLAICEAVDAAHTAGVTHRDLSPSNVIVDRDRQPRVIDFGLVRSQVDEVLDPDGRRTQQGFFLGKQSYASPEQARGDEAVTQASDVFSLGVMLYEMLNRGRHPFPGETPGDRLAQIRTAPPLPFDALPPNVPGPIWASLEQLVMKTLKKDPQERIRTAGELFRDVREIAREIERQHGSAARAERGAPSATDDEKTQTPEWLAAQQKTKGGTTPAPDPSLVRPPESFREAPAPTTPPITPSRTPDRLVVRGPLGAVIEEMALLLGESLQFHAQRLGERSPLVRRLHEAVAGLVPLRRRVVASQSRARIAVVSGTKTPGTTLVNALLGIDLLPDDESARLPLPLECERGVDIELHGFPLDRAARTATWPCRSVQDAQSTLRELHASNALAASRKLLVRLRTCDLLGHQAVLAHVPYSDATSASLAYLFEGVTDILWAVNAHEPLSADDAALYRSRLREFCDDVVFLHGGNCPASERERLAGAFRLGQQTREGARCHFVDARRALQASVTGDALGIDATGLRSLLEGIRKLADPSARQNRAESAVIDFAGALGSGLRSLVDESGREIRGWWRPDSYARFYATRNTTPPNGAVVRALTEPAGGGQGSRR